MVGRPDPQPGESLPTLIPTPTPTETPIPIAFSILSVRVEKYGSKPDRGLKRQPLKRVRVATRVYLSTYIRVTSAPSGAGVNYDYTATAGGRTMLHRIDTSTLGSQASGTFRSHVAFAPSRPGQYRLSVRVTLGNQTRSKSATIQVVR